MRAANAGKPPTRKRSKASVPPIARCESRLKAETQRPVAREKNNALTSARAIRQNSPAVTPPSSNGRAVTGSRANKP